MVQIIDGNLVAKAIHEELALKLQNLEGRKPCVALVRVGNDPASISYVTKKSKVAAEIGIESRLNILDESITQAELNALIDKLNADETVDSILVQAPLPKHLNEQETFNRVSQNKDVDGFSYANLGLLVQENKDAFVACTPAGVVELIKRSGIQTVGKRAVIIGRSLIVGKPLALCLMQKGMDASVIVCHSRSENLKEICLSADIIIAAVGRPNTLTADMVKQGAAVIDVGINRIPCAEKKTGYRLVGDVDYENVAPKCSFITPVPGGVGPMTVAMLMSNTVKAFFKSRK